MIPDNAASRREKLLGLFVLASSFLLAAYFLFDTLVNPYVINHDAMLHIFWMQSFHNPALFRGDLLAEYSRYFLPLGIKALYWLTSFAWDPLAVSKVVPVFVFSLSAYYVFKLVRVSTDSDYCGLLGAGIFMVSWCFMQRIVGGHARAFGFLLLSMAMYYAIKKKHRAVSLVLISECLFYPIVFFPSVTVYAASLVSRKGRRLSLSLTAGTSRLFLATLLACGLIVAGKYASPPGPALGKMATRSQILENPVFYQFGCSTELRLPMPSLYESVKNNLEYAFAPGQFVCIRVYPGAALRKALFWDSRFKRDVMIITQRLDLKIPGSGRAIRGFLFSKYGECVSPVFLIAFYVSLLGLGIGLASRRVRLPREFFFLFCASIAWYYIARLFLPRLFIPTRYLEYPLRLTGLVLFCGGVGAMTARLGRGIPGKVVRVAILAVIVLSFLHFKKPIFLADLSGHEEMYRFCASLPEDTVIAGHPQLVNGIPLFSHRRAFVTYQLSYPFLSDYWKTVSKRTDDFFAAYYSADFRAIDGFCRANRIGWFIVDESHFSARYLAAGDFYFQPFNSRIGELVGGRRHFALMDVPAKDRSYVGPGIFVVNASAFRRLAAEF